MTIQERYDRVTEWFEQTMPDPHTELHYRNPFELLVAVILSAQCTDARVNIVTPPLFEAFPDAQSLAAASIEEITEYIKSVTFPNNKAKSLKGAATMLVERFGGEVPDNIDDLTQIPGVGRKTANVMLAVIFGKAAMAVDTHVFRVSERIGLTQGSKNPVQTEKTLTSHFPAEKLSTAHHWLILHGRYVCKARRPLCTECGLTMVCAYYRNEDKDRNSTVKTTANGKKTRQSKADA